MNRDYQSEILQLTMNCIFDIAYKCELIKFIFVLKCSNHFQFSKKRLGFSALIYLLGKVHHRYRHREFCAKKLLKGKSIYTV